MLNTIIYRFASSRSLNPAVIDKQSTRTWNDLVNEMEIFIANLEKLKATSPIMILLPQLGEAVSLLAACAVTCLDAILVSAFYEDKQVRGMLAELAASQLITCQNGELVQLAGRSVANNSLLPPPQHSTAAVYVPTSGSTGQPKYARHTWQTLSGAVKIRGNFAEGRWLLGYPISRFAGLQVLVQCLFNGGTLVIPANFSPQAAITAIDQYDVNYLSCTPTYLRQILLLSSKTDWSNTHLRHITLGGEIVDQQILDVVATVLPQVKVTHIYASTESGTAITVTDGRAGFPVTWLDNKHLKVMDGELIVRRSPRSTLGYFGQQPLKETWILTGDLVAIEGDRVQFLGRADDVINVGGFKVNPVIVEQVIRQVTGIHEASVVSHRSSIVGNLVKAILWVDPKSDQSTIQSEVHQHCIAQLPSYMVPRLYEFNTHEVEFSVSQKLLRRRVK